MPDNGDVSFVFPGLFIRINKQSFLNEDPVGHAKNLMWSIFLGPLLRVIMRSPKEFRNERRMALRPALWKRGLMSSGRTTLSRLRVICQAKSGKPYRLGVAWSPKVVPVQGKASKQNISQSGNTHAFDGISLQHFFKFRPAFIIDTSKVFGECRADLFQAGLIFLC